MGNTDSDENRRPSRPGRTEAAGRDHRLAALAASQHGVVTLEQLTDCGFTERQVKSRTGRTLFSRGTGVFAVGHPGLSRTGRAFGALLLAGDQAGLSHQSAARFWELRPRAVTGPIHISVRHRKSLVVPTDVVIHRPRSLAAEELVSHRGFTLTSPERTVADHLPGSSVAEITRMLELMVTVLRRSPDDLHAWGHSLAGLTGVPKLHRALDEVAGPAVIRSEFEGRFRSMCQEHGLPAALTNHRIGRWEVDAVWPRHGVAVELDSWRWHGGKWQFHRDRQKGLDVSRAGYELIRLSWPQLKHESALVVEALRHALARGEHRVVVPV